ncbi:winged helix DNA-binding domain-containing protein [Chryseolinea lacunae]|uniref:AlkZ family DNA glycosylase n=1 Tax=Chryseolinea lacunae TaxID=2801331 RepID=A0ABS1KP60_9BACT|nr:winged helix DNA-binding domain-containing protein [Chryseolinea lacunae]MBL0740046.1 AlkZ family DNA glycosylase [Chryseolinea lacunae]
MKHADIARLRLHQQQISHHAFSKPEDVVQWLGTVQAQDYLQSLWAVGLRLKNGTEKSVEDALAKKTIVRTWPLRGTLHYVMPEDVRWMLNYLAPRVVTKHASVFRKAELDTKVLTRSMKVLSKGMEGNQQLTRQEVYGILTNAKINIDEQRGLHILVYVALQGLICVAPRKGKQPTFTLMDEWIPATAKIPSRDEALAQLAKRYFTSHGPATVADFAWWAGLTLAEAKKHLEDVKTSFETVIVDGETYWFAPLPNKVKHVGDAVYFLPPYDEYTVAYKDRSIVLDEAHAAAAGNGIFSPVVIADQRIAGTWKRTLEKDRVTITPTLLVPLSKSKKESLLTAAKHYGKFLGMTSRLL